MSRSNIVNVAVFLCLVIIAHVQCRNLALNGGISSAFYSPFRVIGKRTPLYTPYRQVNFDSSRIPRIFLDEKEY